ncbi:uncharacterized protein LOC127735500 [Mytilus californianus]|uniref:uncharacterized protein LOC127735500 n=1 Tax=Mytilus californianus TaxID=6549 RepID=UPI0022483CA9|nr:uncharacterized protein LOC127735500 [Mytilus californianus]
MKEDDDTPKTFQCSSSGNPVPTFQWKKDDQVLHKSLQISTNRRTGELTITKPSIRDFDTYQCFATNKYGTAVSAAFKIERAVISSFSDTVERTLPNAYQYRNLSIPCTGKPRCKPDNVCRVEWKLGKGTSNTIYETKRIAIDKDGTLHFLYVDLDDGSTAAKPYACGVNNELMRAFYKGGNVIMSVFKVTNPSIVKPLILFAQDVHGLLGGDAELQCVFSGYPLPDIEWYSSGFNQPIQPSGKYQFTDPSVRRNLRIKNLNITDEGTYICRGVNILGTAQARIYVNVTSKPIFQEGETLKSQIIPDGQNAVFKCKMESLPFEKPPSVPIWRRNGKGLYHGQYDSNLSHKYQLSADKEILTIKSVKYPEDSSSISCETGNVIFDMNGEDSYVRSYAYAFLRVTACPPGFILTNGTNCEPCTENWYGNDCLCVCKCNTRQRCDNVLGCVNTQTSSRATTTQSTNPRVFDRNLVVYILVIACGMILMLGLLACKKIWKKGDTRQVQTINEDNNLRQRHIRVTSYNGIYDEIEALGMVENSDINLIQIKNIANANEATGNSDDTYYLCPLDLEDNNCTTEHNNYLCPLYSEDNNSTTEAPTFAVHASCRSIHTSDQSNYVFESDDYTRDSNVYENIYDVPHEPCGDTDDSPEIIEQDNVKDEYLNQYQPLQDNWKQAPQTYTDTFTLHPWTVKTTSSSDKKDENTDQENYVNGNMQYSLVDERLYENQDNFTHSYLQLLSVAETSTNKDETIC